MKLAEYLVRIGYYGIVVILLIDIIINKVNTFDILYCSFLIVLAVASIVQYKNYNVMRYFYLMITALLINHYWGTVIDIEDTIKLFVNGSVIVASLFMLYFSLKSLNQRKDSMDKKEYNNISYLLTLSALVILIQLLQITYLYHFSQPIINVIIFMLFLLLILNIMSLIKSSWRNIFIMLYCLYSIISVRSIEIIFNYLNLDTPYRQIYSHFYEFSQIGCNGYYIIDDLLTYEYPNIFLSVYILSIVINGKNVEFKTKHYD